MRRLILSVSICALGALSLLAGLPAGAAGGSLAFCDTATGTFQVSGTAFAPGAQLLVWTGWDATAGIGNDSRVVTADAAGQFRTTFPAGELPTTVEVSDTGYVPVAGPFTASAIGPCSTAAGQPSVATSTVTPSVNPPQLPADGISQTNVTVLLKNADAVPLTVGGQSVTVSTTAGSFAGGCTTACPAHDNGDGTYTATLTAPTAPAAGTVTGYLNGTPIVHTATVTFTQLVLASPVVAGPAGTSNSPVAQLTFSGANTGAVYLCSLDGAPYSSCTSPFTTPSLADGAHTLGVEQTLNAVTSPPAVFQWTIATPPPVPTITSSPNGFASTADATFAFTGAASGTTFVCSLDNAPFAPCASPVTYPGLASGPHAFSVEQVRTGIPSVPATVAWTIDTTPPVAPTLTATPNASGFATSASFSFSDEAGATFRCSLDGAAYSTCVSGVTYPGLAVASHTFSVEAVDLAGNVGAPTTYDFVVVTPPTGCSGPGSVSATQVWKSGNGRSATVLSAVVHADCDLDRSGNVVLHHATLIVITNGNTLLSCNEDDPTWHGDIARVDLTSDGDAVLRGSHDDVPFTVTLHDGGRRNGNRNDTIRVQYGTTDTSTLSTSHGAVAVRA